MFYKLSTVLLLICYIASSSSEDSDSNDWVCYQAEKCFQILDPNSLETYEEAEASCLKLDPEATLPIIHSSEEEEFLVNYLFKAHSTPENFWLGAHVENNISSWTDQSEFNYENWDATRSIENEANHCVQIESDERLQGKWLDVKCAKRNPVVCQKIIALSSVNPNPDDPESDKITNDKIDDLNKKYDDLEKQNDELKKEVDELKKTDCIVGKPCEDLSRKLDELNKQVDELQKQQNDESRKPDSPVDKPSEDISNQLDELNKKVDDLNKQIDDLKNPDSQGDKDKPSDDINQKLDELEKKNDELQKQIDELKKPDSQDDKPSNDINSNEEINKKLDELEKEVDELKKQNDELKKPDNQVDKSSDESDKQQLDELNKKYDELEKQIDELKKPDGQVNQPSDDINNKLDELEKEIDELKKEIDDSKKPDGQQVDQSSDEINRKLDELEKQNDELKKEIDELKKPDGEQQQADNTNNNNDEINQQLDDLKKQNEELRQSLIPIGFLYTQLPNEKSPSEIWSWMEWTEVSETFANVFFRVLGDRTADFGELQHGAIPRTTNISRGWVSKTDPKAGSLQGEIELAANNDWSERIITSRAPVLVKDDDYTEYWRFYTTSSEVRPINMAVRIWKRTA